MKARHQRLLLIGVSLAVLGIGAALVLTAFRQNLVFFFTPSQVATGQAPRTGIFRVGGLVEPGSVRRQADGVTVAFVVSDHARKIQVQYQGALPDLFKEGRGAVVQGRLAEGQLFVAQQVLAKHDENYMPAEAAYALQQGQAQGQASMRTLAGVER
ncbi:cytochrome c maturation protein CcmE [Massilia sp. BJB1822]|uniref:cytochrome c maturation protein CcmE n=1 Tax=Massilia sp. BJB1822 TaxID=2744470 RepID=UPI001593AAB9|nr:cytochrome c maturation protein CcmE [Massilia sp. BJB1822]NVD97997.1 cytochrome c maturation protein CcmE [Massilia sp. BJB1822]